MDKHTQPPWKTNKLKDGNVELVKDDGSVMAVFYGDDKDPLCWPVSANAQLAATSPKLISSLRDLEAFVGVMCGKGPDAAIPETIPSPLGIEIKIGAIMRDARAAIAEATGTP